MIPPIANLGLTPNHKHSQKNEEAYKQLYPPAQFNPPFHYVQKIRRENTTKQNSFFLFMNMALTGVGISCFVIAIVAASWTMFRDVHQRQIYQTTTFLTTTDKNYPDSWQILTQTHNKIPSFTTTTDIVFDHYFDCWFAAGVANKVCTNTSVSDYKSCISTNYATLLATCATTNQSSYISPSLNQYVQCVNTGLSLTRQSQNGFEICLRTHPWPLYETPQDVDSEYWLGSFNWMQFLTIGLLLFSCFALYTGDFVFFYENTDPIEKARTAYNGVLALVLSSVGFLVSCIPLIYALISAFRYSDQSTLGNSYPYPSSVATNNVILPAAIFGFVFFGAEIIAYAYQWFMTKNQKMGYSKMTETQTLIGHTDARIPYSSEEQTKKLAEKTAMYFPSITTTWADAYLLDIVMFTGIIGSTMQLSTVIAYQVFIALCMYRFCQTSLVRLLYEGYIHKSIESRTNPEHISAPQNNKNKYCVRQQAVFMHLATIMSLITFVTLLMNSNLMFNEFGMLQLSLWAWFVIPEFLRLALHLIIATSGVKYYDEDKGGLTETQMILCYYAIWIWDVVIRLITVSVIVWGTSATYGTAAFWDERLINITETIAYMTAA
jgi:hypothetical protein